MQIDQNLISYLEDLSCLTLSKDEKSRLELDLTKILNAMAHLNELPTDQADAVERTHPFDDTNAFRQDEVTASTERALILKNAPKQNAQMFIAPKTVE